MISRREHLHGLTHRILNLGCWVLCFVSLAIVLASTRLPEDSADRGNFLYTANVIALIASIGAHGNRDSWERHLAHLQFNQEMDRFMAALQQHKRDQAAAGLPHRPS